MSQGNTPQTRTSLVLNIAPVQFPDRPIQVGTYAYTDRAQLRSLRAAYWGSHVFRREGDEIFCVTVTEEVPSLGTGSRTIRLSDHLYLCAALVRNALLNNLHAAGQLSFDYEPVEYLSTAAADDLLAASLPPSLQAPSWLSIGVLNALTVRPVYLDQLPPFVGVALDFHAKHLITSPCSELLGCGLDIRGLYVSQHLPGDDPRVAPLERPLGRIREVQGDRLLLDDIPQFEGAVDSVTAQDAFLEPRFDTIDRCLSHLFGAKAGQVRQAIRQHLSRIQSGPYKLERLRKRMGTLVSRKNPMEMMPGVPFTFEPFLAEKSGAAFPLVYRAERPLYVFDPTGLRTAQQNDDGLTQYGPYSAYGNLFTPNIPNVVVICQKDKKGRIGEFLEKFRHGIAGSRFATGFVGKYRLSGINFEFFLSETAAAKDYERAAHRAIHAHSQADKRIHLALVQIEGCFRDLHGGQNPYLVTKAAFLTHQIPVQEFTIEKATRPDRDLGPILNTMALAAYAKLGGTPWLLPSNRGVAHELVFGLGSAQVASGRLGERRRFVGITTVFSGDGNYRLATMSQAVPFIRYQEALLDSLRETIIRVRTDNNWQPGDAVRLIFHAFKPMKYTEVDAVTELMKELGQYEVDFAFLHLAETHPYLVFDQAQPGVPAYGSRLKKGELAPVRGTYFRLSAHETVMSLVGSREVKKPEDGMPRPLLLKLHEHSTFTDDIYLARQVFIFSCHSWRNFTPGSYPVTIQYSEMIARMLGELESVPEWTPSAMYGRIGETRWFL